MNPQSKILVTGAAGFIASYFAQFLNQHGFHQLILMDDFSRADKQPNHEHVHCISKIDRNDIDTYLSNQPDIDCVIHLGAKTDTTEMDYSIHDKLNVQFSKKLWNFCTQQNIPLLYASSAATYGNGELGYTDDHQIIPDLKPLNPYGVSKNEFDKFVIQQTQTPPHWYGLKFFNVYGPNEYHKGRMASVMFHAFHQIQKTATLKLFKSHHPDYIDGGQMRDFIYVKDIANILFWLMNHLPDNGIYNAGTGKAETFNALAAGVFDAMQIPLAIEYIDTPLDIREKYQYFTEANMNKLHAAGYTQPFTSLHDGIQDYVRNYLKLKF